MTRQTYSAAIEYFILRHIFCLFTLEFIIIIIIIIIITIIIMQKH